MENLEKWQIEYEQRNREREQKMKAIYMELNISKEDVYARKLKSGEFDMKENKPGEWSEIGSYEVKENEVMIFGTPSDELETDAGYCYGKLNEMSDDETEHQGTIEITADKNVLKISGEPKSFGELELFIKDSIITVKPLAKRMFECTIRARVIDKDGKDKGQILIVSAPAFNASSAIDIRLRLWFSCHDPIKAVHGDKVIVEVDTPNKIDIGTSWWIFEAYGI